MPSLTDWQTKTGLSQAFSPSWKWRAMTLKNGNGVLAKSMMTDIKTTFSSPIKIWSEEIIPLKWREGTAMAFCFCGVLHMILSSATQFSASLTMTRHLGCTHTPGIGIWLTMSYTKEGQAWRESDKGNVRCRLLDWLLTSPREVQTLHPANKKTPRAKGCNDA